MSQAGIINVSSQSGVVDSVTGQNGVNASPTTGNVIVTQLFQITSVSANYPVVAATDFLLNVTTASIPIQITLPAATYTGRPIYIKDISGNASINNISVIVSGGATIDGQTTYKIAGNYGAICVVFGGTNYEVL